MKPDVSDSETARHVTLAIDTHATQEPMDNRAFKAYYRRELAGPIVLKLYVAIFRRFLGSQIQRKMVVICHSAL